MAKKKTAVTMAKVDNAIGVRLLPGDKERLLKLAEEDGRTVSRLVARILNVWLNNREPSRVNETRR